MRKKLVIFLSYVALLSLPAVSLAVFIPDTPPNNVALAPTTILNGVFEFVWPTTVALIIIIFIVIGFMFLLARGDPSKLEAARRSLIWGVAGVGVILLSASVISIVRLTIGGGVL